jgi:hypothetical protein
MCSLIEALHNFYFDKSGRDNIELGKRISSFKADLLMKAAKDIEQSTLAHQNVMFNDLTDKPKEVVKGIYEKFGWEYSREYDEILDEYLAKNAKDRNEIKKSKFKSKSSAVLHEYKPENYGLTAKELSSGRFREYIEKFKIPLTSSF